MKIFIVEDNDYYRELLKKRLEKYSKQITCFSEGSAFLKQLYLNPDLIILDHNLEDTNGLDLLKDIKSYDPDIHVVFITGQEKLSVVAEILKSGAFDYLEKNDETFEKLDKIIVRIIKISDLFNNKKKRKKAFFGNFFNRFSFLLFFIFSLSSCISNRILEIDTRSINISNIDSSSTSTIEQSETYKIKPDDKLTLSIWGNDELSVGSTFGIYNSNEVYGKWILVDEEGFAVFPAIGSVKLGNLSIKEATQMVTVLYAKEILNPIIIIRVLNKQITVMGEVKIPGVYQVDKENNNLFELLGRAGGTNYYANHRKITILRGEMNNPDIHIVNLKKAKTLGDMTIYLKPNDVVYVPPVFKQRFDKDISVMVGIGSIITSLALLFTGILK